MIYARIVETNILIDTSKIKDATADTLPITYDLLFSCSSFETLRRWTKKVSSK